MNTLKQHPQYILADIFSQLSGKLSPWKSLDIALLYFYTPDCPTNIDNAKSKQKQIGKLDGCCSDAVSYYKLRNAGLYAMELTNNIA